MRQQAPSQSGKAPAICASTEKAKLLIAETAGRASSPQAQMQAELRVVAQLRMRIQWQVVGEQVHIVPSNSASRCFIQPVDPPVLAAPEQTMVDENRVRIGVDRGLDQCQAGGHARDDLAHLVRPSTCRPLGP